jgi:Zn finger protein HypA/HybF involved in hydrogenase expression
MIYQTSSHQGFQERFLEDSVADRELFHIQNPDHLQEAFEFADAGRPLAQEDFMVSSLWWYACRVCENRSLQLSRTPRCSHCDGCRNRNIGGRDGE